MVFTEHTNDVRVGSAAASRVLADAFPKLEPTRNEEQ
jgi:hypothetical protein